MSPPSGTLRFHEDAWDTPMRWRADGSDAGRAKGFMSPYRPCPEVIEREAGATLHECYCCTCFREDVREIDDDGLLVKVCRACWP